MFNTTVNEGDSTIIQEVTKEVHLSITPDKVAEMYDKIREQVKNDILGVYEVKSNILDGIIILTKDSYSDRRKVIIIKFTLNGRNYTYEDYITDYDTCEFNSSWGMKTKLFDILFEHYKEEVAKMLVLESVEVIAHK